jgi:arabinofuranan 3-O-arabinosyltransferase
VTNQTLLSPDVEDEAPPPRRGRRWAAWRFPVIAYAGPVAITVLATRTWFSPGRFAATGDIPPFVRDSLAHEVVGSWSHQATGAGATSTAVLQLVEIVLIRAVGLVGLGAPVAQWLLYVLCFGLCTFGAAYLAAAWVRRPVAVAAAALLASFNVYLLVWLPNPLPPLAIGLAGLLAGMAARAAAGRRINPVAFGAATMPAAYVALNPPWLLVTILTVLFVPVGAGLVGGRPALHRVSLLLIRSLPWVVLLNLWWVVPVAQHLLSPAGLAFSAVTDIRDWAWTHTRNSVANVVTLNANWAWNVPGLFPYAASLGSGLRGKLHWLLPLLAFAGVVLATGGRRRRAAWLVAGVGLVLLFLSTGVRSSKVGWVNLWLYDHVPGMWLIRDPASKLGVPTVLIYTSLAALALDRTVGLAPRLATASWLRQHRTLGRLPPRLVAIAPQAVAAGVVLGALAYPSPMWTGSAFPDWTHGEIPSSRVAIPAGWHRLADAVNATPGAGKVLTLPVNLHHYTVATNWGYRGVDAIPAQLLKRPTLHLLPGGYYDDLPAVKDLIIEAQDALLGGDQQSWRGALRALGVDTVIVRHDLLPASYDGPLSADPDRLDAALAGIGSGRPAGSFGFANLYHVTDPGPVSARGRLTGIQAPDPDTLARAAAALPDSEAASADPNQPVDAFTGVTAGSGDLSFTLAAAGRYRFERPGPDASYRAALTDGRLTFTDTDSVAIDGYPLPNRPAVSMEPADPNVVGLDVAGTMRALPAGGDLVTAGSGTTVTAYGTAPGTGLTGPFRTAADCTGVPDIRSGWDPLRLAVRSGRLCAEAPVQLTDAGVYRIRFRVRSAGAATPGLCLWQDGPARCAPLPAPPYGAGWSQYTAVTRLLPDVVAARLYVYAESGTGSGLTEYRDLDVTPLRPVGSVTLAPAPAPPWTVPLSAGRHTMTVRRQVSGTAAGTPAYGNCPAPGGRSGWNPGGHGVLLQPDRTLLLDAPRTSVCAQLDPVATVPGATYRFVADYRTGFGQTPQVCLMLAPAGRCAGTPDLTRSGSWQTMTALVRAPAGTTSITPQVFADATAMVPTRIAYRNVSLTRTALVTVRAVPADLVTAPVPQVRATAVSPSVYQASVHGAAGRFTLVLPESYAPGWQLTGLPPGWTARHLIVSGYANAWLVSGTGDAELALVYAPSRWSSVALVSSILTALAVIALFGGVAVARTWGRRRRAGPDATAGVPEEPAWQA